MAEALAPAQSFGIEVVSMTKRFGTFVARENESIYAAQHGHTPCP